MATYRVHFEIEVPDDAPLEDIEAFLRFELGEVAQMSGSNYFRNHDIESFTVDGVTVS